MINYPGRLITFEGIDNSGKSEQAKRLSKFLQEGGYQVFSSREPGGDRFSEVLRDILKYPEKLFGKEDPKIHPRTELLLFESARTNLVENEVKPALQRGEMVVLDRFIDSTWAFQGYGNNNNLDDILLLNRIATGGLRPDLTLYCDADPVFVLPKSQDIATFEKRGLEYQQRVRAGYLYLSAIFPNRFKIIPRVEGDLDVMEGLIRRHVRELLTQPRNLTIYHAVKIANRTGDNHLENSRRIMAVLQRYGRVLGEHFLKDDVKEYEDLEAKFGINALERDMMWIAQSDIFAFNVHPQGSIGVGREIDRARIAFNIPVIAFYDETKISHKDITKSITADKSIKLVPFKPENLEFLVNQVMSDLVKEMIKNPVLSTS